MAISYPLNLPTSIGISDIELMAYNAVAISQSPFTYKQQVISHAGERWEASISIPPVKRDLAEPWTSFLLSLRGPTGTFLLGDPNASVPQGTISAGTLSGNVGNATATVTLTGSLKAGDYIQLGTGNSARLHKVLVDATESGNLEIWPKLRLDYTDETIIFNSPKGLFRLKDTMSSWSINNASVYGLSFSALEVVI